LYKEVRLKIGASESSPPLIFEPGPMTVFVGPNNSGKSLILQEIPNYVGQGGGGLRLIAQLLWKDFSKEEVTQLLLGLEVEGAPLTEGSIYIRVGDGI
jgi:hypothetical protein